MISINKTEAEALRNSLPNVHIVRTMKQKSKRGHYYCEESRQALKFIERLRSAGVVSEKAGDKDRYQKKSKRV